MIKDFSKFKRLFVFGCSYTLHKWPTWAHVLASEIDNVELYNFGRSGSGNLFISLRVAEANKRFKFNENDLVVVMWTSFTREDRWIDGYWEGNGNIFNQSFYPESWVKEFVDPDFCLMRDLALMELTSKYLKNLPCTSLFMSGWPIDLIENNSVRNSYNQSILETCSELYKDIINEIPLDIRSFETIFYNIDNSNPNFQEYGHTYINLEGKLFEDGHPNTTTYREYLKYIGFPLTDKSKQFAETMTQKLKQCKTESELMTVFKQYIEKTQDLF